MVLALNVFQLILNDQMPKTGYMTPMHSFLLWSIVLICLAGTESLIVYKCFSDVAQQEAVASKLVANLQSKGKEESLGVKDIFNLRSSSKVESEDSQKKDKEEEEKLKKSGDKGEDKGHSSIFIIDAVEEPLKEVEEMKEAEEQTTKNAAGAKTSTYE